MKAWSCVCQYPFGKQRQIGHRRRRQRPPVRSSRGSTGRAELHEASRSSAVFGAERSPAAKGHLDYCRSAVCRQHGLIERSDRPAKVSVVATRRSKFGSYRGLSCRRSADAGSARFDDPTPALAHAMQHWCGSAWRLRRGRGFRQVEMCPRNVKCEGSRGEHKSCQVFRLGSGTPPIIKPRSRIVGHDRFCFAPN